ncbi:MAG: hypothetical protein ABJ242_04070 [Marinomonas sp.]
MLEPFSAEAIQHQKENLKRDLESIENEGWEEDRDATLEEARRVVDAEMQRRKGAETKAATYLAVVSALVPVAYTAQGTILKGSGSIGLDVLNVVLLSLGVCYIVAAGVWAFRTLKVSVSARVDIPQLLSASRKEQTKRAILQANLVASRNNWAGVNRKVTNIKMAHEFLLRAFLTFALLVLINGVTNLFIEPVASAADTEECDCIYNDEWSSPHWREHQFI